MKNLSYFLQITILLTCLVSQASTNKEELLKNSSWGKQFIENKGQIIDQQGKPNRIAKYLLNGNELNVQIRAGGFSYDIYKTSKKTANKTDKVLAFKHQKDSRMNQLEQPVEEIKYQFHRIDLEFVGANANAQLIAEGKSTDYTNYYNVAAAPDGIMDVHQYSKIIAKNIYNGIDVEYLLNEKGFKYNFIVHAGAKISDIKLRYTGAPFSMEGQKLMFNTSLGTFTEAIPASWLIKDGTNKEVQVSYTQLDNNTISFSTQAEHSQFDLVIDPNPYRTWGTFYGGSSSDYGLSTCTDGAGSVYLAGFTVSATNIATTGSHQATIGTFSDAFLVKFNTSGVRQWGTYYGGDSTDRGTCTEGANSIYLAGSTNSPTNIATTGSYQVSYGGGGMDAFLVKFNLNGVRQWGTYYGGSGEDWGSSTAYNLGMSEIYLLGSTASSNNIATTNSHQVSFGGGAWDAFLVSFNSNGARQWATYYGGSGDDYGYCVSNDKSSGGLYFAGITNSTNNISSGGHQATLGGNFDAFLVRFTYISFPVRSWGTYYGGAGNESVGYYSCINTDGNLNVYLTGGTGSSTNIATTGSHQASITGSGDAFLVKFNINGVRQWGTYYGGSGSDAGMSAWSDNSGNVYVAGNTNSINNIATAGSFQESRAAVFVVKFNTFGVRQWGTYYGNWTHSYECYSTCMDASGNLYLAGFIYTTPTNPPANFTTPGCHQEIHGGSEDAYLAQLKECTTPALGSMGSINASSSNFCINTNYTFSLSSATANASGYLWSVPQGWSIVSGQNTTSVNVIPSSSGTISVRAYNTCRDTSGSVQFTVNNSNNWLGTTSTNWGAATNWQCGVVPTANSNVVINAGPMNMPIISDSGRICNNITIGSGASLTLNNTMSQLIVRGLFINNGTLTNTNGDIQFNGSVAQTIPSGTYRKITLNNSAGVSLAGNVSMSGDLDFRSGILTLGSFNLNITGTTGLPINFNSNRFVVTNGTGLFTIQNIGSGGRIGAITFPVAHASNSYNPVTLTNFGSIDAFSIKVDSGVSTAYSGNTQTGSSITADAVNRTWYIKEGTAGGSNVTLTLQWDSTAELPGFNRNSCYVANYSGGIWMPGTAGPSGGSNPFTISRSGITTLNLFGVGKGGSLLPVEWLNFNANRRAEDVELYWATATEINNSHFIIERSTDAYTFMKIDEVKGSGISYAPVNYKYIDANAFVNANTLYYRLKQVDYDGVIKDSKVISISKSEQNDTKILIETIYPNPFINELKLELENVREGDVCIEIYDLSGRLHYISKMPGEQSRLAVDLGILSNLTKGMYILNIRNGGIAIQKKLVKLQ